MKVFDSLVTSNIRQRPLRSAISVIGVALGVALVMLFTGLTRGMSNDLARRSTNVRGEIIFTRKGSMSVVSSSANLSTKYVERLRQIEGVEAVTPVIRHIYPSGTLGFDQIEGVDWERFSQMNGLRIIDGRGPQGNYEVVIDQTKAARNHPVGSTLKIFGDKPYTVVGIYAPESGARQKLTLASLQETLEVQEKCTYILIKTVATADPVAVAKRIDQELPGNNVQFTKDVFASVESSIPSLGMFLRILVALAAVVSALVIMLAMHTTITERTREIGILKAMGASRAYIVGEIEREALVISAMGLVVGFGIALGAGFLIHKSTGLLFEYGWTWALAAAAIGLIGGAIGALYPAMRAANLDPVQALAYE
jgi:putative ABC transport system permease protein